MPIYLTTFSFNLHDHLEPIDFVSQILIQALIMFTKTNIPHVDTFSQRFVANS